MVHTAQLLCLNVKITSVFSHFGYVMVTTTVAMVPMKNFICAVRGSSVVWQNLFLMWNMCSWRQLYNFEYGTHDLLHCDFTWLPCLVLS